MCGEYCGAGGVGFSITMNIDVDVDEADGHEVAMKQSTTALIGVRIFWPPRRPVPRSFRNVS